MATSIVKLYIPAVSENWRLLPEKCFYIEDIETYLSSFTATTLSDFQYIKNQLEVEIKVNLSARYSAPLNAEETGFSYPAIKYVSIKNSDENRTYYYFVKKVEWRSTMSCKLNLVMDVINTTRISSDYAFDKKTHITRQHKNRIVKSIPNITLNINTFDTSGGRHLADNDYVSLTLTFADETITDTYYIKDVYQLLSTVLRFTFKPSLRLYNKLKSGSTTNTFQIDYDTTQYIKNNVSTSINYGTIGDYDYIRKIDLLSEGINPPLYTNKANENKVYDNNSLDWYLIYKNQEAPTEEYSLINPVDCFLCANEKVKISYSRGRTLNTNDLEDNCYYYIMWTNYQGTITDDAGKSFEIIADSGRYVQIHKNGNNKIQWFTTGNVPPRTANFTPLPLPYDETHETAHILCQECNSLTFSGTGNVVAWKVRTSFTDYDSLSTHKEDETIAFSEYIQIDSIADVDRTDAKLIKIIKLPYSPLSLSKSGDKYVIDTDIFEYNNSMHMLKLKNLNNKFLNQFSISGNPLNKITELSTEPVYTNVRNDIFESKIYHSDFYIPKFIYDSFSFGYQLEKLNINNYYNYKGNLTINFITTTTINSRFMFMFPQYITNNGSEDYDNVMPIARNNEIALYNVAYLNYIRSGYNYDVKSKQRTEQTTWLGTALLGVGALASLFFPGKAITIPLVIGMGTAFTTSLVNSINTTLQQEENMQRKLDQLKMQSASVNGSDDVDLMSVYTGNKAKLNTYQVSAQMKSLLLDLFYYMGYNENITAIPTLNSRKWFNFIACEPIFQWNNPNIPEEIKSELTNLYKNGITILHKVDSTWDIEQVKENAETTIEEI